MASVNSIAHDKTRQLLYVGGQSQAGSAAIAQYSLNGRQIWIRYLGSDMGEIINGVCVDSATGDVYISGITSSSDGFDGESLLGYINSFVARYSSSGERKWSRIFGSYEADENYNIAFDQWRNNAVVLSDYNRRGLVVSFNSSGDIVSTYGNTTISRVDLYMDRDLELMSYRDIAITSEYYYLIGRTEADYYGEVVSFISCINPTTKQLIWRHSLINATAVQLFGLEVRDGIAYITGGTLDDLYESEYDEEADSGGNAFVMAFDLVQRKQLWTLQWGVLRSQMIAVSAASTVNAVFLSEYSFSRGPAFVSSISSSSTSTTRKREFISLRSVGWTFLTNTDLVVTENGYGYCVGAFGRSVPNLGYMYMFTYQKSDNNIESSVRIANYGNNKTDAEIEVLIQEAIRNSEATSTTRVARVRSNNNNSNNISIELPSGAIAGIVIGNILILAAMGAAVYFVGRHYYMKKVKEEMERRRQLMIQMQANQTSSGIGLVNSNSDGVMSNSGNIGGGGNIGDGNSGLVVMNETRV